MVFLGVVQLGLVQASFVPAYLLICIGGPCQGRGRPPLELHAVEGHIELLARVLVRRVVPEILVIAVLNVSVDRHVERLHDAALCRLPLRL